MLAKLIFLDEDVITIKHIYSTIHVTNIVLLLMLLNYTNTQYIYALN